MKTLRTIFLPAAVAAGALLALPAAAEGPDLPPLDVTARPTAITISLAGKAPPTVYGEIGVAARTVCRNAVETSQVDLVDYLPCRLDSQAKARRTYAKILKTNLTASQTAITLSVR